MLKVMIGEAPMTRAKPVAYKRGDRVRHSTKTDWGLGEVLDDQMGDKVWIIFEDVGLKQFSLERTPLDRVVGDEALSPYLNTLVQFHRKHAARKSQSATDAIPFAAAVRNFLGFFPTGFADPKFISSEREYKVRAHEYMREYMGPEEVASLVGSENFKEICDRALEAIKKTNLIHYYEVILLRKAMASDARQRLFAVELVNLLHGTAALEVRFESFVRMLYKTGAAKWTIATYFLFVAFPNDHFFLKPEVTKHAAGVLHYDIEYKPEVNWRTYDLVLGLAGLLKTKLVSECQGKMVPRDMIDVQSFVWVIGPGYFE